MRAVLPADPAAAAGARPAPVVGDLPDPVTRPGEVLVAVEAAGLNRADQLQLAGLYPPPPGESDVPGLECAGHIVAVGDGVDRWKVGAKVMALLAGGGQATRVAVPAGQLLPLPENLSYVEGAALPEAGLTGWTNLVVEGGMVAGQVVLVTGASGGIGSFAVQLARELGGRARLPVRRAPGTTWRDPTTQRLAGSTSIRSRGWLPTLPLSRRWGSKGRSMRRPER